MIGEDSLLVNPAANDFSLTADSVARNTGPESPVFALFQSLYGIGIRKDCMGKVRPAGASWDVGAIEFCEGK